MCLGPTLKQCSKSHPQLQILLQKDEEVIVLLKSTVDPYYSDCVVTVQLECFVVCVRFIRVFEYNCINK